MTLEPLESGCPARTDRASRPVGTFSRDRGRRAGRPATAGETPGSPWVASPDTKTVSDQRERAWQDRRSLALAFRRLGILIYCFRKSPSGATFRREASCGEGVGPLSPDFRGEGSGVRGVAMSSARSIIARSPRPSSHEQRPWHRPSPLPLICARFGYFDQFTAADA
jgi:hypothetical protein